MGRGGRLARNAAAGGIEFVAPRTGLFGTGFDVLASDAEVGPASFGEDPTPPRWGTAVAVLSVVGLLAVGVVAAAPWDGDTAPAPTTLPTPSTAPATTAPAAEAATSVPGTLPPGLDGRPTGYVLDEVDVPDGYELAWANVPRTSAPQEQRADVRLWAQPNATRASGSWLATEIIRDPFAGHSTLPEAGAARIAVGTGVGAGVVDADGVATVQWQLEEGPGGDPLTARLTAHGWTLDEVAAIAGGMRVDGNGDPTFADPAVLDGLQPVLARTGFGWGLANELLYWGRASVGWLAADDRLLTLTTLDADPGRDKTLYDFLLAPIADEPFTGPKTFWAVDDLTLTVGRLADVEGTTVKWTVGDATMLLSGELPATELVGLATKVRVASTAEWRELSRQALLRRDPGEVDRYTMLPPIGGGTSSSGATWTVSVSVDGTAASLDLAAADSGSDGFASFGWYVDLGRPQLYVTVTASTTYVVSIFPGDAAASQLHAAGAWGERLEPFVPVVDEATGHTLLVSVMDVPELGGFTVDAIDGQGTVLATEASGTVTP